MTDLTERDQWADRIQRARVQEREHGSLDALLRHLRSQDLHPSTLEPLIPLLHDRGYTGREIAECLDMAQSRVSRRLRHLIDLELCSPIDMSRGGGNTPTVSDQVKAARVYSRAAAALLESELESTPMNDRAMVRSLILDETQRILTTIERWGADDLLTPS